MTTRDNRDSDDFDAAEEQPGLGGSRWERSRVIGVARGASDAALDVARDRFPLSIVWTPLPGITACAPVVGHTGIADSRGVIYDFAGPFSIAVDDFSFGRPYLYLTINPEECIGRVGERAPAGRKEAIALWDSAVDGACDVYARRVHNICCDNW